MASLNGKWTFTSYENIEAFLDAIAVPDDIKQKAIAMKPDMMIAQDGDQWTITTIMGDKSTEVKFQLGEEFDRQNLLGKTIKSKMTLDGEKLIEEQSGEGEPVSIAREVTGDQMISTISAKGVSAVVKFQKA